MTKISKELVHAALSRYAEEVKRTAVAVSDLEAAEERYTTQLTNYVVGGHIKGGNETERKAREAELLSSERAARNGARVRLRRCELWLQAAHEQLETYRLLYAASLGTTCRGDPAMVVVDRTVRRQSRSTANQEEG